MSSIEGRRIEVREGNETLRALISGALGDLGFDVVSVGDDSDPIDEVLDLLFVDVDSGLPELEERVAEYDELDKPVVHCGVRVSRDRFVESVWLERPFTRFQLYEVVVDELGIDRDEVESVLGGGDRSTVDELREPITRELEPDSVQQIEREFGLDPGTLDTDSDSDADLQSNEESDATYVLDPEDDELVMSVGVAGEGGGQLGSAIRVRRVEADELRMGDQEMALPGFRSPTFNQTMPETPAAIESLDGSTRETAVGGDLPLPDDSPRSEDLETNPLRSEPVDNDVASQFRGVARSLAESWERIALTARTEDRADQIERILRAALSRGVKGASEEIMRLPQAQGFSGNLEAMPAIDLLRTIRDRRLRGRLEVASHQDAYVLYLEGANLEEIDTLSAGASSEEVLIEVLTNNGALAAEAARELQHTYSSGEMMLPLENRLIRDQLVSAQALREARASRAKAFFRQICAMRRGQFAFIEVQPGDGNPWPVEPLRLSVDTILLELLREASFDTGDSRATSRTRLVLDPARAAAVRPSMLTDTERRVLELFRNAETVGQAREILAKAPPQEVDRIVNRMKQLEILKRSDPFIDVPPDVRKAGDKHTSDTVVSDIADVIGGERARQETAPAQPAVDPEGRGDQDETAQKASFDLGIVADRLEDSDVDDLVARGIAAYEDSDSDADSDLDSDVEDDR